MKVPLTSKNWTLKVKSCVFSSIMVVFHKMCETSLTPPFHQSSLYERSTYVVVILFAKSFHSSSFNTHSRFSLIAQSLELCAKGIDCASD
mmetsp:Transcript_37682/g.80492  ORF Transcript_37682/g.80492 Transcript_37682/m.80492 type:complete len:90 (+) Transcript_37682:273-542(+)